MSAPGISTLDVTSPFISTSITVSLLRGVIYLPQVCHFQVGLVQVGSLEETVGQVSVEESCIQSHHEYTNGVRTIIIR